MKADDIGERLQTSLGASYTLERELGGGGMSRVFVATDRALDRRVVVKVLRSDVAIDVSAERFAREIRLAARLQQANIVPVLAAGDADGLPWYTMPFVEGASLRVRLAAGAVPAGEAMGILRDLARALAYAHAHGVVHRDVKPENVLLSGGAAVVTDFGIAKALDAARDLDGTLTRVGTAVGTPAYMAPEQAAGEDVDARADVYAWGVVAFEILTGAHPFAGKRSGYELVAAHLTEAPPAVREAGVPPALATLVARTLAKDPDDRPEDAGALLAELDAVAGAPRAASPVPDEGEHSIAPPPPAPSIAVLPFESLSSDPENQYLADGIAEEITNALARLPDLRVAARTSASSFRGRREDARAVGEKLGVATLLEGSVRRAGDRLRVTAQLIDTSDGCHRWSARYDREVTDIFAVQDEIASAIADTLEVTLGARSDGIARPPTSDLEAFRLYHKGLGFLRQRGGALREAVACFERAVARDYAFAHAHAALSEALSAIGFWGAAPPRAILGRARAAAARAMALAPDLAASHSAAAFLAMWYDRDADAASRAIARTLELGPHTTNARASYALYVLASGHHDYRAAMAEAERAAANDPLSAYAWAMVAIIGLASGDHANAVAPAQRAVALDGASLIARIALFFALAHRDPRADEARAAASAALAISGRLPWVLGAVGAFRALDGERAVAEAIYAELTARTSYEYVPLVDLALAAAGAGHLDAAMPLFERALDEQEPRAHVSLDLEHYRYVDVLRAAPGFADLRARLGWGARTPARRSAPGA